METNNRVYSVRDISLMAKNAIERVPGFDRIAVRGEAANVRVSNNGHLYFSLKEGYDVIPCVIWANVLAVLTARGVEPRDGSSVVCTGKMTTYSGSGTYQLQCSNVIPEGEGAAALAFEALKRRLEAEGLFGQKRRFTEYPKKIAVITAPNSDALRDIKTNVLRRYPIVELCFFPATVQGETAPKSLTDAFEAAQGSGADIIIFGRGGGSREDLSCFDDERVARAIFASRIPTISAVGHETDFTIADFVADVRASTPTGAAELAVPEIAEIWGIIQGYEKGAARSMKLRLTQCEARLSELSKRVQLNSPSGKIAAWSSRLESVEARLKTGIRRKLDRSEHELNIKVNTINGVNPLAVLSRGYSVTTKGGKAIKSSSELNVGDTLDIKLDKGEVSAKVTEIIK
ncbi:MAG: exodeoxyribonuclease VII large subunit [Oscillospiraceae bacterium]|nr:exodeoxyribonuclease VII large subunit [Oscillospiraceae bacterium]